MKYRTDDSLHTTFQAFGLKATTILAMFLPATQKATR